MPLGRAQDIKVKVTSMVAKLVLITPILLWLIIRKKNYSFFLGGGFETHLPSRGSHIANEHHPTNLGIISNKYSQLPKSWRNPKNLEISLGEGFCGSRGDAAFSLCLG